VYCIRVHVPHSCQVCVCVLVCVCICICMHTGLYKGHGRTISEGARDTFIIGMYVYVYACACTCMHDVCVYVHTIAY
jgi:hypothetical protein